MFEEHLTNLLEEMKKWQKKISNNPDLLEHGDNEHKNAIITRNLPKIINAIGNSAGGSPDIEEKQRACIQLLSEWHLLQSRVISDMIVYYMENIRHYLIIIAGTKSVSDIDGILQSFATSATSALTGDAIKMWSKKILGEAVESSIITVFTAGGAGIGGPKGALIGFFIGLTIDFLVGELASVILGNAEDIAVAKAKALILDRSNELSSSLTKKKDQELVRLDKAVKTWKEELSKLKDYSKLLDIEKAIKLKLGIVKKLKKKFPVSDRTLGNRLLKRWVLENMGDDNDEANDSDYEVKEPSWELAVRVLKEAGALAKTGDDKGKIRDELTTTVILEELAFLHQLRNELTYTAINIKSKTFRKFYKEVSNYAKKVGGNAQKIEDKYDGAKLTFTNKDITDSAKFVKQIEETYDGSLIPNYREPEFEH